MPSFSHGAQKTIRARGSSKCPHHIGKQVVYDCENCKELACISCVSTAHKGHDLEELANIIPNSKTKIQDFINESENHDIPRIKGKIQDVDSEMSQKKQCYQEEINQIKKQNEILKEELDKVTRKLIKSYRDMEKKDMAILHNHKTVLQDQIDDCYYRIQECKNSLRSDNDVQVYDVSKDLPSELKDIPTPALPTPSFNLGKFKLQLEKLVGEVTRRAARVDLGQPSHKVSNYSIVSQFTPYEGHYVNSMHPAPGNKVWICLVNINDGKSINKMLLVNQRGVVQQTLDMEVNVQDFCLSPGSGILWFCGWSDDDDCTVREVRGGGGSVVRFTPDKEPWSICLTSDDHVVIGHEREVVKYTQTGEVIHKTPGGDEPLMIHPYHISQCPNTGHLAVVDLDIQKYGGSEQPVVWILDDQLNLLYKYCGDTPGGQPLTKQFDAFDACYTANGSLAIADWNNKSVLLVNEKGEYVQTLYTRSELCTTSVCVHHDGAIWVTFYDGSIQLLKSE